MCIEHRKTICSNKRRFVICILILGIFISSFASTCEVQAESVAKELNPSMNTVLTTTKSYILSKDLNPDYSSIWNVIGLTRSGMAVPSSYTETFYKNTVKYLEEKDWVLSKTKYSDYSKLILGMTTIGKDAQNIAGHNLLAYLSDFSKVKMQGFNGPIWALIALKSHPTYVIPLNPEAAEQTTEEGLIKYLLNKETAYGGWTLSGNQPDTDITGMTIQALSPYYGVRSDVTKAIDRAIEWLSGVQLPSGGYGTMGTETSESVAQVIVALSSIGLDPAMDDQFIKDGYWPMTGLFQYYLPEGGFMHVAANAGNNGGAEGGVIDGMATEQGFYATVAYKRMLEQKNFLYDMSDIELVPGEKPSAEPLPPASTEKKEDTTQAAKTIAVSMVRLDYSQISVIKGQKKTLSATVLPATASNKKVKWKSSNTKIATVTQSGVVKGVKKGSATITVTAQDGSGKKASCKVTVTEVTSTNKNTTSGTTQRRITTTPTTRTPIVNRPTTTTNTTNTSNTTTQTKKKDSEEASTQAGWSFDGEDYVPETYDTEENTEEVVEQENINSVEESTNRQKGIDWDGKNLTIRIPVGPIAYILLGMAISGGVESIIFFVRKKKK